MTPPHTPSGPAAGSGAGERAGWTDLPPPLDRRIAFALDTSSWVVLVVMSVLGLWGLRDTGSMVLAGALCLVYGLLDAVGRRHAAVPRYPSLLMALQTLVVAILLALPSDYRDAFAFLLVMLSIRCVLFLGPRAGAAWIALFWLLSSAAALWEYGLSGLVVAGFNLGVYPLCGMVGYALAALARSTAERADALAELQLAQARLRRVAVDEERRRLGRDLHDSVKQQVFATTMQIGAARALLADRPERASEALDRAEQAARRAGTELNTVIHELRSAELDGGVPLALQRLTDSWAQETGTPVRVGLAETVQVPEQAEHALLRVAEEALSNVARHAGARQVEVSLAEAGGEVVLTIADDGRGYDPGRARTGVGVSSMQERVTALDGRLDVHTAPGGGTTVRARVPSRGEET